MKHHEREFFISTIRTGNVYINDLIVKPPTVEQSLRASIIYINAYEEAKNEGVMTEDEMLKWMMSEGFWHKQNDIRIEKLQKQADDLKVALFQNFTDKKAIKNLRFALRETELKLSNEYSIKNSFFTNTCESFASLEKNNWLIENTTYLNENLYSFDDDDDVFRISSEVQKSILKESIIRELARTEPWKSNWSIHKTIGTKLFINSDDQELTTNQKSLVIWSKLYDNIYESIDCPQEEIIQDDDCLDGWFIHQNRKREKEKKQKDIDEKLGSRVRGSQEVFVMSSSAEEAQNIYDVNSENSRSIIKQRSAEIMKHGEIEHHKLSDQKLKNIQIAKNRMK